MMLECAADFDAIAAYLGEQGPPHNWKQGAEPEIAVPKGPIAHW
jgi:hypothetical protein